METIEEERVWNATNAVTKAQNETVERYIATFMRLTGAKIDELVLKFCHHYQKDKVVISYWLEAKMIGADEAARPPPRVDGANDRASSDARVPSANGDADGAEPGGEYQPLVPGV